MHYSKKEHLLSYQTSVALTVNVRYISNQVCLMTINALNFFLFLCCFATSVSQLKIMIQQWEPIKLLEFQPRCAKTVSSMVLTDNTLELVSKHWHWQLQHQIWQDLPTEAWTACSSCHIRWWNTGRIFSFWQGLGMENIPRVFWLIEPATSSHWHTILPADIRFTRTQNPTDSAATHHPPYRIQALWLHLEKAIKAWVRKRTNLTSGEMHWNDTLPYHRALNSDTKHMLRESLTSPQWLHMHAWAEGWNLFEEVIYKIFTIWLNKHIPKQCNTIILSNLFQSITTAADRYIIDFLMSVIQSWAVEWPNFILKPVAEVVSPGPLFRELLAGGEQQWWGCTLFFGFHGNLFTGKWSTNRIAEPHWIGYGGENRDQRRRLKKHNNRTNPRGRL